MNTKLERPVDLSNHVHCGLAYGLLLLCTTVKAQTPSAWNITSAYDQFETQAIMVPIGPSQQSSESLSVYDVDSIMFTIRTVSNAPSPPGVMGSQVAPAYCMSNIVMPCVEDLIIDAPIINYNSGYTYTTYKFRGPTLGDGCDCSGMVSNGVYILIYGSGVVGCSEVWLRDDAFTAAHGLNFRVALNGTDRTGINFSQPMYLVGPCGPDSDSDGIPNNVDGCPLINGQQGSQCGDQDPCTMNDMLNANCQCTGTPNVTDSDGDGTINCNDACPNDPNKTSPGVCGCGNAETDTDGDGVVNCADGCPNDPNKNAPGTCGCGVADTDTDLDGVPDCNDNCPTVPGQQGSACNDGNPNTNDDKLNSQCVCTGHGVFTDHIAPSGLPSNRGDVICAYDHDNDGLTDVIWVSGQPSQIKLMRNNGDLTFSDISSASGFAPGNGNLQTLDVDNNGWTDVLEFNWVANTIRLHLNTNGTFTPFLVNLPVDLDGTARFIDFDNDGAIDLLSAVKHTNGSVSIQVANNDVCGSTVPSVLQAWTPIAGPFAIGINPVPYCFDYDNDGDQDLLVVMDGTNAAAPGTGYHYQPVKLYRNDGGTFLEATVGSGLGLGHNSGCGFWDYDSDGDLDITFGSYDCCDTPNRNRTYKNNGNGTFTDVSASIVLRTGNNYYRSAMVTDIENDGDLDLYWWQGAWGNSQLYINNGGGFGANNASGYGLSIGGGTDQNGAANGIRPCWFDADNDGDLDVLCGIAGSNGSAKFMVNPVLPSAVAQAHYLSIRLAGCASGRSASNALVRVYSSGSVIVHSAATWYHGGPVLDRLHFGLGSATTVDSVVVYWPSGSVTRQVDVPANQLLVLEENPDCIFTDCIGATGESAVALRIALEGAIRTSTGLMGDELRALGLLPLEEPYTALGYFHIGGGGDEETTPAVLSVTGPNAIVDWVVVELRDPDYNGFRVASRSALLQRDGDVVDMDGVSPVTFTTTPGTYFLSVKHRNHLGVMTATPISFGSGVLAIDFTAASTAVFGTAARKVVGGTLALWTGDATFNGQMKYTGAANDRDPILVRVGSTSPNNTTSGYFREDTNMDGLVKYTGTSNDRDPILVNVGSTAPNNVRNGQVP